MYHIYVGTQEKFDLDLNTSIDSTSRCDMPVSDTGDPVTFPVSIGWLPIVI